MSFIWYVIGFLSAMLFVNYDDGNQSGIILNSSLIVVMLCVVFIIRSEVRK